MSYYRSDFEILVRNPVWKELKENAAELLENLRLDLESLDPITQPTVIARVQGKIEMVHTFFDGWVSDVKRDIEEMEEETRNGRE